MQTDIWSRRAGWLGMVCCVLLSGAVAQAQSDRQALVERQAQEAAERAKEAAEAARQTAEGAIQPSEYWIGVATSDELINETVRAQLGLEMDEGIAVLSVRPDSPAAQAGLRENDVLVQAGERRLRNIQDLIRAVDDSKGQELSLVLYREGKQQTLTVTPTKRPSEFQRTPQEGFRDWVRKRAGGAPDDVIIDRWFSGKEDGPLGMLMVRPGVVLPPGAHRQALPDNMTVTITKHGKEPAKISVRRDDQSWDVTDETLSELPEDVRAHVESMLAHHAAGFNFRLHPPMVERFGRPIPPGAAVRPEDHLDAVQRQVQELRQSVEELQRLLKEKNQ